MARSGPNICGWCAGAPVCAGGATAAHKRCYSPTENPCVCGVGEHELTGEVVKLMAQYCQVDEKTVRKLHARERDE